jgi:protein gp37
MSTQSSIEWTDATWNPVRGCEKVSPGCAHCYAETFAERFRGVPGHPYEQGFDLRLVPEKLTEPLTWKKPRRVFVNSMSDLFQDGVPFEFIDQCFAVMACAQKHTFQVLTKRPARMLEYMLSRAKCADYWKRAARDLGWALEWEGFSLVPFPLPNVWLGVSVENQHFADERIPLLLQTPAAVRFISAEPLLEFIDLCGLRGGTFDAMTGCGDRERLTEWAHTPSLDWVIVGGESGQGARPFNIDWARQIIEDCELAGVACFVKQLGSEPRDEAKHATMGHMFLRNRKGGDPSEWPEDLRVREFPFQSGQAQP